MMEKSILRDFWKDMQSIWSLASLFSTDKNSEHISCCITMPKIHWCRILNMRPWQVAGFALARIHVRFI